MTEYRRAFELDPTVLLQSTQGGVTAQISVVAKPYAQRDDAENALMLLETAKENGYRNLNSVYTDDAFVTLRHDTRLAELIPPLGKQESGSGDRQSTALFRESR